MRGSEFDVAIVAMTGRFPGAGNVDDLWANLRAGVESVRFYDREELAAAGVDAELLGKPEYVGAGSALAGADLFDAPFFGYSAREAELLDPQQRLLLECAWETFERAGYDPAAVGGSTAVYVGTGFSTYLLFNLARAPRRVTLADDALTVMMGNDKGFASTRVAYHLDLRGPCVDVSTACSTSLVAVAMAYQSLLAYQCDLALAGGVSVNTSPGPGYLYREGGPASPDGHCRAFDRDARGTIFGSGLGLVLLKRLEDALADGDTIHAVVKGAAMNNDGAHKVGYAAPSVQAQAAVVAEALASAGVDARSIGYVEAHGTGTELGDPIEVAALTKAFRATTDERGFCALGSLKTNVGHLDAAAGVAGLIKAVLALERGEIPPSLHFDEPNPAIDFATSPFYVNAELRPWERGATPRRAGVSSFGFGGTNVHVVLEEAPANGGGHEPTAPSRGFHVVPVSARTPEALERASAELAEHLAAHPSLEVGDVAFTLQLGRRAFEHRRTVVAREAAEAAAALERAPTGRSRAARAAASPSLAFMFPGQAAQHPGMAESVYETVAPFREVVDRCADALRAQLGLDLRHALYPGRAPEAERRHDLEQPDLAQPALFVTEYALASTLVGWGIHPAAMIGHSFGEYVAAALAEVFSVEDALALVTARGRLMQTLGPGAMIAVDLPRAGVEPYLADGVALAAVNGSTRCVLSGPLDAMDDVERRLADDGVPARRLRTSHAFHSPMTDALLEPFRGAFAGVELRPPQIPYVSNVTGTWIEPDQATDPAYWATHLRRTVEFERGLATLLETPERVLVEVGPGRGLTTLARNHEQHRDSQPVVAVLPRPGSDGSDVRELHGAVGEIWAAGAPVDWAALHAGRPRRRVALPTYPFERRRYWVDPDGDPGVPAAEVARSDPADWVYVPTWRESAPEAFRTRRSHVGEGARWLLFADGCGIGVELAERLRAAGDSVAVVRPGRAFRAEPDGFVIRADRPEDYAALLDELAGPDAVATKVVHLWSLDEDAVPDRAQELGFYSLVFLARALLDVDGGEIGITVVTTGVQSVSGDEELKPGRATILGACKVVPQELPGVSCRAVDVVPGTSRAERERVVELLLAELDGERDDPTVAYRGRRRWAQRFERARPEQPRAPGLHPGGVYLITGGFGRVGRVLAEHLAAAVEARLVLVGRTSLPPADAWDAWLEEHADDDPVSERIRTARRLETLGAEVLVVAADVAEPSQMQAAVEAARARFGRIDGVVHLASETDAAAFAPIARLDRSTGDEILRSRLVAAPVLADALADVDLDFCVLQSSLASVLGGPGLAAYAAGNAYLDAFAHVQHAAGRTTWISIDWDVWRLTGDPAARGGTAASPTLDAAAAAALFERLAGLEGVPQAIVSPSDLPARVEEWLIRGGARPHDDAAEPELHPRPPLEIAYAAPASDLERDVARAWEEVLRVAPVGVDDDFFALGGDSILATQLLVRLRASLRDDLPLSVLFDSPTVRTLTTALEADGDGAARPAPPLVPLSRGTRVPKGSLVAGPVEPRGAHTKEE